MNPIGRIAIISLAVLIAPAVPGSTAIAASGPVKGSKDLSAIPPLRPAIVPSLSIKQAMEETLMRSPRATSMRLMLGIAKSSRVRATELPNPTAFMDNGYRAEFTYRYGFLVPVEPVWKLAFRLLAAKNEIKLADLEIAKGLWALRGDIRRAYNQALVDQERFYTISRLVELYRRVVNTAQKRFGAGEVARVDVMRAERALAEAEVELELARNSAVQARQVMSVLMGRPYDSSFELPRLRLFKLTATAIDFSPDYTKNVPVLKDMLDKASANRLELKIVAQAIKTNGANLKVAYGNIAPNPAIGVGSSVVNGPPLTAGSAPPLPQNIFRGYFFQTFVELPILNVQQGDISMYRAKIRQLRAEMETQKNIVESEVVQAHRELVKQRERIKGFQDKLISKAQQIALLTQKGYEVGEIDLTSVLVTQESNVQVRNRYLDAIYDYEVAFTNLEQAIGTTLE
ncbi:MAG: TolC family protein [Cyanobacteria bacterium HKST-UBA02]|nr:TolC family protein [Cyanobacteria bacterium HKST-UBA02]